MNYLYIYIHTGIIVHILRKKTNKEEDTFDWLDADEKEFLRSFVYV